MSARLNIGLIGSGFMGQAHADAYRRAAMFYPDLPKRPHLYALADQDQAMAERHAAKLGAEKAYGDWRELVNDPQAACWPTAAWKLSWRRCGSTPSSSGSSVRR
uniref:Gfo/Idh/MocA-like oxidoreductase N-terminal domain-containing protein n=1 Tax=Klebsiella pneumoniae TaxID=573 RepID=A0A483K6T2_KLEPN